jgi:hypothetical protein
LGALGTWGPWALGSVGHLGAWPPSTALEHSKFCTPTILTYFLFSVKKETTTSPQSGSISNEVETIIESDDLRGIFRAQSKLFVSLIKMVQENPGKSQTILKQLNHFQIEL